MNQHYICRPVRIPHVTSSTDSTLLAANLDLKSVIVFPTEEKSFPIVPSWQKYSAHGGKLLKEEGSHMFVLSRTAAVQKMRLVHFCWQVHMHPAAKMISPADWSIITFVLDSIVHSRVNQGSVI